MCARVGGIEYDSRQNSGWVLVGGETSLLSCRHVQHYHTKITATEPSMHSYIFGCAAVCSILAACCNREVVRLNACVESTTAVNISGRQSRTLMLGRRTHAQRNESFSLRGCAAACRMHRAPRVECTQGQPTHTQQQAHA